jgi:hypothetical protein
MGWQTYEANSAGISAVKSRQPIFKSLAIILGIQVGGWLISELAFGFLYLQNMNSIQMWHMAAAVNCFVCATAASDPIVLFATRWSSSAIDCFWINQ